MPTNQTSTPSKEASTAATEFVSIKDHLRASWEMTKGSLNNLILMWLVMIGVTIGLGIVVFTLGFSTIMAAGGLSAVSNPADFLGLILSPAGTMLGLIFFVAAIAYSIFSAGINSAVMLTLSKYQEKPTFKEVFNQGMKLALPVYLLGLVIGLMTLGGFILFLIPGLIMAIFLSFALFERIFHSTSLTDSLRGSYTMVKDNFGFIFTRWLVVVGFYLVFFGFVPEFFGAISESLKDFYNMVTGLAGILVNWMVMAFFILLYHQIRQKTNMKNLANVTWMWLVAGIGWMLIGILSIVLFSRLPNLMNQIEQALDSTPSDYSNQKYDFQFDDVLESNVDQADQEFNFNADIDTQGLSDEQQQAIEEAQQAMDDYFQELNNAEESAE